MNLAAVFWVQADLQKYVAALSRPYSKRTKAELVESLLDAIQQHRDSHMLQGGEDQGRPQRGSEVAPGGLEVGRGAAYNFISDWLLFAAFITHSPWPEDPYVPQIHNGWLPSPYHISCVCNWATLLALDVSVLCHWASEPAATAK